jgi:hypothetical protein
MSDDDATTVGQRVHAEHAVHDTIGHRVHEEHLHEAAAEEEAAQPAAKRTRRARS